MANTVCLITNELFPLDKGGIGRLMWNFAVNNAQSKTPADLHFLVHAKLQPQAKLVEDAFKGLATIDFCRESLDELGGLGRLVEEADIGNLDSHIVESLRYYAGLRRAQHALGREFDIVEFPDFGGWAAASIAAKRAGVAFQKTRFVIRLHSTFARIADHEPFSHEPSDWMAGICDLEYQSLRDADLVIAHLPSIAQLNADHFPDPAEWRKKVRVEMPPIALAEVELKALAAFREQGDELPPPRKFLFSARLQPFKRPDLFVRAAVHFLDTHGGTDNLFLISSYGFDPNYVDWIERLVPLRWQKHILSLKSMGQKERAELMLNSILVIPSDFESCCLLAYEGRMLGVKMILNRRCLAFGAEPERWRERKDCLFFEGDFISLADAMEEALAWNPEPAAPMADVTPYWETPVATLFGPVPEKPPPLKLAFVVYGAADLDALGAKIQELEFSSGASHIHVLAPYDAFAAASVQVSSWQMPGISVHATGWVEPTPTELQHVVSQIDADAVAFLPVDMRVERHFWTLAAAQLAAKPDAGCFTSHVIVHKSDDERGFRLNYGDAPTVALITDRIAHRASVFRRDRILELGLRELAGERWHEDFCIRLVDAGHKVLVAPTGLVIETGGQRYSRIKSSQFFGSHRDEAGALHRAPYRQGSASTASDDSMLSVSHHDWLARSKEKRLKLTSSARSGADILSFDQAVLKNVADDGDYRELEIVLRGLAIGRHSLNWLSFKLSQYRGLGQLEFREGGNANQFFKGWPPTTTDEWGPVAVYAVGSKPHPQGVFFERLNEQDARRLGLLLDGLSGVIAHLPLDAADLAYWDDVAKSLATKAVAAPPATPTPAGTTTVLH